jgi:FkbM family methyltransferase
MDLKEYEQLHPNMVYTVTPTTSPPTTILFFTPNSHCAWRVDSLDSKEPDTIAWLAHMRPGEVLFDVGANMGQYALIAAAKGLTVHAFEPESQNFALLMRNITVNDFGANVTAWPLCLSDEMRLDTFHVQSLAPGGSCSSFGQEVNFHLKPKKYAVHQGSVAIRLDAFVDSQGVSPDHVKIDVDGLEHLVVAGMTDILPTVKSVLVEINTALQEHMRIYETMAAYGLAP